MNALARILVVSGAAVALTAATVGVAFFGATTWLTLGPLGAGAAAVVFGLVAGMRHARIAPHRLKLALEIAGAVVVVIAVNAASLHAPTILDVTKSKRNTLTEASIKVARDIKAAVVVKTTLAPTDRAFLELDEMVARYHRENALITLSRVSTAQDPEAVRQFGDEKVIVARDDVRQRVRFTAGAPDQEEQLTNALRAVSLGRRARVYFLAGHGEPAISDDDPSGMRQLGQALVDEGLEVVPLPLAAAGVIPDDAGALVVANPTSLSDAERAQLQKYLDGGGRMLLLLEPGGDSFASLIGSVGVMANDDVVIDASRFAGVLGPETATGVGYASHAVTSKLDSALTHFSRARSLSENPGTGATVVKLVETGADSFGAMHLEAGTAPAPQPGDLPGPLTLMMAATNAVLPGSSHASSPSETRLVVAGDSTFATNQGIRLGSNRDLAVNAILWLVEREGEIAIRPRGRGGNLLLLTPTARERIAFVLLYGLPVVLLCAGLSISALRRRR